MHQDLKETLSHVYRGQRHPRHFQNLGWSFYQKFKGINLKLTIKFSVWQCPANMKCSEMSIISIIPEHNYVESGKQQYVRRCNDLNDQIYFRSITFYRYLLCSKFFKNIFPHERGHHILWEILLKKKTTFFFNRVKESSISL